MQPRLISKSVTSFAFCIASALVVLPAARSSGAITVYNGSGLEELNINAEVSGISNPNGVYSGSTLIAPLQVSFPAGTYTGTVVTPLTQGAALYTAWTYSDTSLPMPYLENFAAFDDHSGSPLTASPVISYLSTTTFPTAALAYADTILRPFTFTLTAPTVLDFVVPDNFLSDNSGGVSIAITPVPEPISGAVLVGTSVLLLARRRRV